MGLIQASIGRGFASGDNYGLTSSVYARASEGNGSEITLGLKAKQKTARFHCAKSDVKIYDSAAVLFADIVGFTGLVEGFPPEQTLDLLARYHARMAKAVYSHRGTVLQFSGDAIMAVFGVPVLGRQNATDALGCSYDMLAAIAHWNTRRSSRSRFPINIGIGIHTGTVAVGKIGINRHRERSIAGDTVNVARKLESMTRKTGTPLIVSVDTVIAVTREGGNDHILAPLSHLGHRAIPGRHSRIQVWSLARSTVPDLTQRAPLF